MSRRAGTAVRKVPRQGVPGEPRRETHRLDFVAGLLAGAAVAVVVLPADNRLFAPYYAPRLALFYPLVAALVVLALVRRAGSPGAFTVDVLDVVVTAFAAWQAVAAVLAPVPVIAWFGAYNRIGGAVFWIALSALLLACRRLVHTGPARDGLLWALCGTTLVAALVAVLQAAGLPSLWTRGDFPASRMSGTTGNPVSLGGLGLLAVWLGAAALAGPGSGRLRRAVAAAGAVAGLVAVLLSVSRAAYLGLLAGAAVLLAIWLVRHRRRAVAGLLVATAVMAVATLLYDPGGAGLGGLLASRVQAQASREGVVLGQVDAKRVAFWRVAVRAVRERPVTGYGPGGYLTAYRHYVPADMAQRDPVTAVSDPHGIVFLLAVGGGLAGLALALGVAALVVDGALRTRRRLMREGGLYDDSQADWEAAAAFSAAALVFLAVSPTEPGVLTASLVAAATLAPSASCRTILSFSPSVAVGRVVAWTGIAAAVAAGGAALWLGVGLWRADVVYDGAIAELSFPAAVRAADLSPWVPRYQDLAGKLGYRQGFEEDDKAAISEAGRRLARALSLDPSEPSPHVDRGKAAIGTQQLARAVTEAREGLRWSPHNPILQAVWGYAAASAQKAEEADGADLTAALRDYPDKVADGWYWLGVAYAAGGDQTAAKAAIARARELAPSLEPADYEDRLRGGV